MQFSDIVKTAAELKNIPSIRKDGLTLTYSLSNEEHVGLDRELYSRSNGGVAGWVHNEVIELDISGIHFIFIVK